MRRLLWAALCMGAAPALAQDRPLTTPVRDVDVVYRSTVGAKTMEQRSRFRAADGKLRLDTPSPGLWMIVDSRSHTVAMISDGDRGVIEMGSPGPLEPGGFSAAQAYTRRGEAAVSGLACTEWQTMDRQGQPVVACFTTDGVLLRARRGGTVLVQAVRVSYGPVDPAAFTIPSGYSHSARAERQP